MTKQDIKDNTEEKNNATLEWLFKPKDFSDKERMDYVNDKFLGIEKERKSARWEVVGIILDRDWYINNTNDWQVKKLDIYHNNIKEFIRKIIRIS